MGNCLSEASETLQTLQRLPRLRRLELAENEVRIRAEELRLEAFDGELRASSSRPPLPKTKGYPKAQVGGHCLC